jgi:hypothetical protein
VKSSRELRIRGRNSGEWRTTAVNLDTVNGARYLVGSRATTQWVRNIRVSGGGELGVGRRREAFHVELCVEVKIPFLREDRHRWGLELDRFFEGLDRNGSDDQVARIAAGLNFHVLEQA